MKKNMLLVAMMMAICGGAFGQKVAKLLWERQDKYSENSNPYTPLAITSSGNTIVTVLNGYVSSVEGVRIYDKAGKDLGSIFGKHFLRFQIGKNINLAITKDSTYLFDKEFSLVKIIKENVIEGTDGLFSSSDNNLYKYDFKGNLIWQYTSDEKIVQFASKTINLFKLESGNYLLLDKNGKFQRKVIPTDSNLQPIFYTSDRGFWLTDYRDLQRFIKYDSTGKQTGLIDFKKDGLGYYAPFSLNLGMEWAVTSPDNSIIVFHAKKGEIYFTKIDIEGKTKTIMRKINGLSEVLFSARIYMMNSNKFTFIVGNPSGGKAIGMADFDDSNLGWLKESLTLEDEPFSIDDYGNNGIFRTFESKIDVTTGYPKKTKLSYYNVDGKLTLSFANDNIDFVKNTKGYIYVGHDSFVSKYQLSDGQLIWEKDKPIGSKNNENYFINDSEGNDYWIYSKGYGIETKIDFISKNTNQTTSFFAYPKRYYPLHSTFLIDYKTKTLTISTNGEDNEYESHILRKYSIRCLYDLEATAEATGKTEVCSGSKVKLSTTEQDGLTYQWQKDGKDIPTFKDAVHDVEESGNYTVTVKDEVCQNQTTSNVIKVTIKPLPIATISAETKGILYEPFTVKLSANAGTGLAYQWLKDDALIANETTAFYEAKKTGKYAVKVTKDGCIKTSDPLLISILVPLANSEEVGEETVQVYPNPSNGNFKIILPKSLKGSDIQLLDSFGRLRSLTYTGEQAQAEGLVQGVYFLKVSKNGKIVTSKVVIEAP